MTVVLERPRITITNVIWSFDAKTQQVNLLLVKRADEPFKGYWALPETSLRVNESAHEAVLRLVREKLGLALPAPHAEQLATFTAPDRAPGMRALSLSYMTFLPTRPDLVPGLGAIEVAWFALTPEMNNHFGFRSGKLHFSTLNDNEYLHGQTPETGLAFDHNWILTVACQRVAHKLNYEPTILLILGDSFTLKQARLIFNIFGHKESDNSNFFRNYQNLLTPVGITKQARPGRPAKEYRLTI